ncbi:MAG: hypothetical protein CMQ41_00190 [Gammaproteobacteria bacterium]|nr:hypothetical protein [Gammaproteobacteria bacterium]
MITLLNIDSAMCRIGRRKVMRIKKFKVEQGQHWCLFGPNGAGKSLLANLISFKRVESGYYVEYAEGFDPRRDLHIVSFEEQQKLWQRDNRLDISEYNADVRDVGTTVSELITSSRATKYYDELLLVKLVTELGISNLIEKGIRFLSSGQIRKVLIARALYAFRPDVPQLLILDDPLESIDADSREKIKTCIGKFLNSGFSSIQLSRRNSDILPSVNCIAVMRDLGIIVQGQRREIESSEAFNEILNQVPVIPHTIPRKPVKSDHDLDKRSRPLVELIKVNAGYDGIAILKNFCWTMKSDDHVLIEGPNGCGKSTLLSLINGENHKAYGQNVSLFGVRRGSGESIWDVKAKFGVVSNELHNKYVKGWKVLDVVVSGFYDSVGLYDHSGAREIEIARNWLSALGISDLEKDFYEEVSFGEQRLSLLARAMVKFPKILILDEPCVGLDDYHRSLILGFLDKIAQQSDTNIIYVSHVVGEKPECINRRLSFEPEKDGGFRITEAKF